MPAHSLLPISHRSFASRRQSGACSFASWRCCMKTTFRAGAVIAMVWLTGCATSYESTWVDPSVTEPIPMAGKPIAVVVMSTNESQRRSVEQIMANEITKLGAKGLTGYSILPPEAMKDQARAKQVMQERGVEA